MKWMRLTEYEEKALRQAIADVKDLITLTPKRRGALNRVVDKLNKNIAPPQPGVKRGRQSLLNQRIRRPWPLARPVGVKL